MPLRCSAVELQPRHWCRPLELPQDLGGFNPALFSSSSDGKVATTTGIEPVSLPRQGSCDPSRISGRMAKRVGIEPIVTGRQPVGGPAAHSRSVVLRAALWGTSPGLNWNFRSHRPACRPLHQRYRVSCWLGGEDRARSSTLVIVGAVSGSRTRAIGVALRDASVTLPPRVLRCCALLTSCRLVVLFGGDGRGCTACRPVINQVLFSP